MPSAERIALLGGGKMASAIVRSLLRAQLYGPEQIVVSEPSESSRSAFAGTGIRLTADNTAAAKDADVIIVAVKPWVVPNVLSGIGATLTPDQLVVSIAAGVGLTAMEQVLPTGTPLIRVMPNLCLQIGEGATALCPGVHATAAHLATTQAIFEAGGRCVTVTEAQMDAVTGLSGSGPAYVCLIIEALADGGVKAGLPRDVAQTLAAQTVLGAARLILESGEHPAVWKDRVATPGGTTIAGLAALEESAIRSGLIQAVQAASDRSRELGKG